MIALNILIFILVFVILMVLVTQVLVPFRQGTRFLPWFRKSTNLNKKIQVAQEQLEELTELTALEKQLKQINEQKASLRK